MLGLRSHTGLRIPLECYVISDNVLVHSAVSSHTVMLPQITLGCVITLCVVDTVMLLQITLGYVITSCVVNTVMLDNVIMCSNAVLYL